MKLKDFENKVMFITDENVYHYFALINEKNDLMLYGSWHYGEDDISAKIANAKYAWDTFIQQNYHIVTIKVFEIEDFKEKVKKIQKEIIKKLFKGDFR